jgi:GxxExxY protein
MESPQTKTKNEAIVDFYRNASNRIYKQLGPGHPEVVYRKALQVEMQNMGIKYEPERPVAIKYTSMDGTVYNVGVCFIDLYDKTNKIIIETKAVLTGPEKTLYNVGTKSITTTIHKHLDQIYKYDNELMKEGIVSSLGMLINFPQSSTNEAPDETDVVVLEFKRRPAPTVNIVNK